MGIAEEPLKVKKNVEHIMGYNGSKWETMD
jgi:hypothetical protein